MEHKFFFRLALVSLIIIQGWFTYITLQYSYLGILLAQNEKSEWVIRKLELDSASLKMNVQIGDIVKSVNGQDPNEYFSIQKWKSIEQADTLILSRDGEQFEQFTVNAKAAPSTDIFPFFAELMAICLAILLHLKAPYSLSARYLALVFLNIGFIYASLGASLRGDTLGKICINTLMMALPIVFLHFLIVFFNEKAKTSFSSNLLRPLYISVLIIFVVRNTFYIPIVAHYLYSILDKTIIAFFLLGLILNFTFLIFVHWKHNKESPYLSTIIKTVWGSLFISFAPFAILSFVPQLLFGDDWVNSLYTSWFVLFFPLSFAYLILAKKLYDIDLVLRRILLNMALSVIPSFVLLIVHALIFQHHVTLQHLVFSFISSILVISFALYSFEYFTTKLEFIIFPRKYYLNRAMKKIANNLCSISSFRELKDMVLIDIVNTLQVFGGAIVYKYQDRVETVTEGLISLPAVEDSVGMEAWDHPSLLRFEINRHEEYTSYLIVTDKKTNTALSKEDMQWLNFIISYLAVSLENMHLIHKLNMKLQQLASQMPSEQTAQDLVWFRKLMFELQEDERKRIATDLHDTTMQDLFFLKKRFASLIEKTEFPHEDIEQMKGILDYVEIINTNLRQNCFELHPHLLHEIGLIGTLRKLVEHEAPVCPFQLEFIAKGADTIEDRDLDAKRHVFRIVQELLNNAKKHSLASIVSVTLTSEGNNFLLVYKDDGIGLQAPSVTSREIGSSGTGLEQMRSRILSLNGQLNIRKDMESGVYLSVTIPMRKVA
ncbi:two-component system, NarL family, sensor histidine kinase ComP [Paenibacillus sp. 1_12]|uniref:sensor histidine kinase n=1 Tax=Paenibacillus sp. 1_12 TaxID=1566278 RepID=UPI0008E7F3B4|nr:ATP-binding protein [Paenibacillus sp. 1_12]SFL87431.1 two-component system, NarL family, sensor histidine kinase ComP [Paenibacillus sp. 1_12]